MAKEPSIAIVGGCGHVGLPLGIAFTRAGARMTLVDTDAERVAAVRAGRMPFLERRADQALPDALATGRLAAGTSLAAISDHEFGVVAIGTPVHEFLGPAVRGFDRVHAAVTADHPRLAGFTKAGLAGGPCLLKDTMQLGAFNHNAFPIGHAAMMINEGLPANLVESAKARHPLAGMTAAILGMAF